MNKVLIILIIVFAFSKSIAQPANDNCASATTLTVGTLYCGQTTVSATSQGGETKPCGAVAAQTVWYKFTATSTDMSVYIENSLTGGCHIASAVWSTSACLPAASLSCKGLNAPIDITHVLTGLTIGNTYLVSVAYDNGGPCNAGQTFCIKVTGGYSTVAGYTAPTAGIAGEYIGDCMTNTCAGQFYDDGGSGGFYANSTNQIYRTFCPDVAGQCVTATINYLTFGDGSDGLDIRNGPTQGSPSLTGGFDESIAPGTTFTSTAASGCLTFALYSTIATNWHGFNITLSCTACTANTTADNNDCVDATAICANASYTGASTGPGISSDGCSGCNTSEHFTNWYKFCISTSGNLKFIIDPTVNTQDYDFALYGPGVTCGSLGTPIRCSYAANTGNTGLLATAGDNSENVAGDAWVNTLAVTAGQCYYLMVSQWSAGGSGFTIDFAGSTASLDCVVLPVELISYKAECINNQSVITWETASEENNDYFVVERSNDGLNYIPFSSIKGAGSKNTHTQYTVVDNHPEKGIYYYRLKQKDYDGVERTLAEQTVNSCATGQFDFSISNNTILLQFNTSKLSNAKVSIYDPIGKLIQSQALFIDANNQQLSLNFDQPNGLYLLVVEENDEVTLKKFYFAGNN